MNNLAKFICIFISVMYNLAKFICNLVTSGSAVGFGSALIRWAEHPRLKNANKDSGSGSDTYLYRFGHMSRIQIRHKNSEYATLTQTIRYRTIIRWNKRLYSRVIYKKKYLSSFRNWRIMPRFSDSRLLVFHKSEKKLNVICEFDESKNNIFEKLCGVTILTFYTFYNSAF